MSILEVNADEVMNTPDLEAVEPGEYLLKIVRAKVGEAKNGANYVSMIMEIDGHPNAKPVQYTLFGPADDDDDRRKQARYRNMKYFAQAFNYDLVGGFDTDELEGLTGYAVLKVEHDEEYGEQNRITRFVTGQ